MKISNIYFVTVSLDYEVNAMSEPALLGATEDSASMTRILRDYTDNIYTLTNAQATYDNVISVLREATSDPDGFLVFHFSGHGYKATGKDGICLYDKILYDATGQEGNLGFWDIIKKGNCRKIMTIFATCYSAGMSPEQSQLLASAPNVGRSGSGGFFTGCLNDIFAVPSPARNSMAATAAATASAGGAFKILCWSPCRADELSYMMPNRPEFPGLWYAHFKDKGDFDKNERIKYGSVYGHEFISRICYAFDPKLTYGQMWGKISADCGLYGYRNIREYHDNTGGKVMDDWQQYTQHRVKTVVGENFEDERVFFSEKSQDDEDEDKDTPVAKKYTVEFRDYDNTTIRTYTVDEGALAPLPDNPTRAGYDFTGWKPDYGAITKDTVYIAQYKVKDAGGGKDVNPVSDAVELSATLIRSGEGVSPVVDDPTYHPGSKRPTPHFYGYRNKTTGPGDSCFSNILTAAQQYGHAMLMVLDNGAKLGSDFCADCNDDTDYGGGGYLVQWSNLTCWNQLSGGMCYFRGSSTAPKACADAWGFAHSNGINTDTGLTLVGFIHDGSQFIAQGEALQASVERFKARGEQVLKQLNQHRRATAGLKPRVLSKKKDVFDAEIVKYNYNTGTYNAGDLTRNDNVEIGVWNGNLQKVLEKADKENVPVFVMFGVANCGGHWQTLKSDQFVNWQLSCNMYLSYLYAPWNKGGYTEQWLESKTYQAYPTPGSSIGDYTYHCPEYAVHWKQPSGNELNIGKYLSRSGDSSGLLIEPYLIEGILSGYFSQYEPISYDNTIIRKDNQQGFGVIGRAGVLRTDNIANKTNYSVSVPYKNLDNIKAYSENYDAPLIAIYFNSSGAAMGAGNGMTLQQAFNVDGTFDTWIKLEDTAIIWADVESSDGGKASENGEWHRWIADLDQHPERASDRWAFRFYSKPHGVDKSYSFQQIYDKTYDSNKTKATENLKTFMYETFKPFYDNVQVEEEKELFIVRFWDFDGTELIPQQQVQKGFNAVLPETDPIRAGYTFIGYSPNGINVQSDLTCIAQYKADESESDSGKGSAGGFTSQYFAEHTYGPGQFQMRTSNNISAIQVVGDMRGNGMTTQLTSVTFQDNLFQIMPSCFMNCGRLRSVEIKSQTRWIGDYAFYGCSRLESVNALAYPKHTQVNTIGAHAFQNTGLTDIAIDLTASQYGAGVGEFAFAGCTKLKNVRLTRTAYIGRQAFDGCTALTSVSLPNSQGYYYPEAFANCTALTQMVIPPKIQTLNNGLFKNCASLGVVEIQDSVSERSQLNYLGASAFTGCDQLTSISIPASISSITQIDPEFLQGSAIKAIHFNGLSDEVFSTGYIEQRTTTVNGYVMNTNTFKTVAADALARSIPIVMITVENSPEVDIYSKDCPRCRALAAQLNSSDWQTYMNGVKSKCYFVMASQQLNEQLFNIVSNPADATLNSPFKGMYNFGSMWSLWPKVIVLYKDLDGKVSVNKVGWAEGNDTPGALRQFVDPIVSKANNPVQDESRLSAAISKLGSPLSYIMAYSKTGKEYKISADSYVETYVPPEVDTTTVSDFKTGKWYYNATELKAYADSSRLPVFAEFSDRYCEPCIKFRNEIYERSDFQSWVAKQPYLFCRIETEYFDEFNRMFTQPYFIRTTWAKNARVTYPGMIFYWNREQNPVWDVVGYGDNPVSYTELQDIIQKKFKNVSK